MKIVPPTSVFVFNECPSNAARAEESLEIIIIWVGGHSTINLGRERERAVMIMVVW